MAQNSLHVSVEGYEEAREMLKKLPDRLQRNVLIKVFKSSSKVLLDRATEMAAIRVHSEDLANSIGYITGRSTKYAKLYVGPRVKGQYRDDGWFGHFVEFGTSGIGDFSHHSSHRLSDSKFFAIRYRHYKGKKVRFREDVKPNPFMAPAIQETKAIVLHNVETEMVNIIQKESQKLLKKGKGTMQW